MLKETEKDAIRKVLGEIKAKLPEYKSRRAQRELIAAVARVLAHGRGENKTVGTGANFLVCEAGTGTGKSHALGSSSIVLGHFLKKEGRHLKQHGRAARPTRYERPALLARRPSLPDKHRHGQRAQALRLHGEIGRKSARRRRR